MKPSFVICCCHVFKHFVLYTYIYSYKIIMDEISRVWHTIFHENSWLNVIAVRMVKCPGKLLLVALESPGKVHECLSCLVVWTLTWICTSRQTFLFRMHHFTKFSRVQVCTGTFITSLHDAHINWLLINH